MAQGSFSVLRGGNFWQGAAAGLFSSFGGSFSGAVGITDFAGIVGVSTAMGAIGSVIAGAKSPEEILFGAVQGAMVGALNFAESHSSVDKRLKIISYTGVQNEDGTEYGAELNLDFTDSRITKDTKVYQMVHMRGSGDLESGWDNGDTHKDPVEYPFAHYEGNNTVNFYDQSSSGAPYKNGDYFNATIYIISPNGYVAKIDWGWHISNDNLYLNPLKVR